MTEQKKKAASAFLVLFIFGIIALPASLLTTFLKWNWLSYVVDAGMLIGAILLYRAVRSKKLLISLVVSIAGLALAAVFIVLATGLAMTDYTTLLWILLAAESVLSIASQLCLLIGAADYLRREQYPETAKLGRSAAIQSVVCIVLTFLTVLCSYISLTALSGNGVYIGGALIAAGFILLAAAIVGIIQIVTRLRFFYQSRKCLLSGLPETVPPLVPESSAGEEDAL